MDVNNRKICIENTVKLVSWLTITCDSSCFHLAANEWTHLIITHCSRNVNLSRSAFVCFDSYVTSFLYRVPTRQDEWMIHFTSCLATNIFRTHIVLISTVYIFVWLLNYANRKYRIEILLLLRSSSLMKSWDTNPHIQTLFNPPSI